MHKLSKYTMSCFKVTYIAGKNTLIKLSAFRIESVQSQS